MKHGNSSSRLAWIALGCVVILASAVRLWHIGSVPEGIWSDEADSAQDAVRLLHNPFQPFAPGNFGHNPALYFYAIAGLVRIGGNTIAVVRLASALFGIAGVLAVFFIGVKARGYTLGLCAAALLAMATWDITFSRVGMPNIPIPTVTGIGYGCLIAAMYRPKAAWFAASGIALGLSLDTYPGAYLPAFVPIVLVYARASREPEFARASRAGRIFLPICLLVAGAPTLTALLQDGGYVLARVHVTSLFNEYHDTSRRIAGLARNLRSYGLMLTVEGDRNGRHNLSGSPMLDPITAALFLLGLGMCLRRWRHWLTCTLLLWLGTNMLSGVLSVDYEAPHGARTLGALAPITLIAALPLLALAQMLLPTVERLLSTAREMRQGAPSDREAVRPRAVVIACIGAILVVAAGINLHRYFEEQARDMRSWFDMSGDLSIEGRAVSRLVHQGYIVRVDRSIADEFVVQYLTPGWPPQSYDPRNPARGISAGRHFALIVPVSQNSLVTRLLRQDHAWHESHLTPAFNSAIIVAYVLSR